jgi:hypothetical protein
MGQTFRQDTSGDRNGVGVKANPAAPQTLHAGPCFNGKARSTPAQKLKLKQMTSRFGQPEFAVSFLSCLANA